MKSVILIKGIRLNTPYLYFFSYVILVLLYIGLSVVFARHRSFWSPDTGVRFTMIRNYNDDGSLIYPPDAQAQLDPSGLLHPLGDYVVQLPRGYTTTYPPLFPLLTSYTYRLFGFWGLAVWPLFGGLGTVALTTAAAGLLRMKSRYLLPLLIGTSTPLVIYSAIFWDPSLQMFCIAASLYCLLRSIRFGYSWRWSLASGAAVGAGVWLHEIFLLYFMTLSLASVPMLFRSATRGLEVRRLMLGLACGFLPLVLLWWCANYLMYGLPSGPHTQGPNRLSDPYHRQAMLDTSQFIGRSFLQLVGDPQEGRLTEKLGLGIVGFILCAALGRGLNRLLPLFYAAAAVFATLLIYRSEEAHGLFQATPLLIPALAFPFIHMRGKMASVNKNSKESDSESCSPGRGVDNCKEEMEAASQEVVLKWLGYAALLFLLGVLVNPLIPGLEWGSRYLLTLLPVWFILAAAVSERQWGEARGYGRVRLIAGFGMLIIASLYSQWRGLSSVQSDLRQSRAIINTVHEARTPLLATDLWWLGAELASDPASVPVLHFKHESADVSRFFDVIRRAGLTSFTYFGFWEGRSLLEKEANRLKLPWIPVETRVKHRLDWVEYQYAPLNTKKLPR